MKEKDFNIGALSIIRGVRHPVSIARAMPDEKTILIAEGRGRHFGAAKGLGSCDPDGLKAAKDGETPEGLDIVGCVALDQRGLLVAAITPTMAWARPPFRRRT